MEKHITDLQERNDRLSLQVSGSARSIAEVQQQRENTIKEAVNLQTKSMKDIYEGKLRQSRIDLAQRISEVQKEQEEAQQELKTLHENEQVSILHHLMDNLLTVSSTRASSNLSMNVFYKSPALRPRQNTSKI